MLSFFSKTANDELRQLAPAGSEELLLDEGAMATMTYGSLNGKVNPKIAKGIKELTMNGTPVKILGALLVLLLTSRMLFQWQAARANDKELQELRARLEGLQQAKGAGYRKFTDSTCGGSPINAKGNAEHAGCHAIRATSNVVELSRKAQINASSMQDRAANLVDGTDSEWWTHSDSAELNIDILRESHVKQLRMQWWGLSYADEVKVSVSNNGQTWNQVHMIYNYADQADDCQKKAADGFCSTHEAEMTAVCRKTCFAKQDAGQKKAGGPQGEGYASAAPTMNGWTELSGWPEETRYVKINLAHGHDDPWKMHEKLGLRRIEVMGTAAWEPCAAAGEQCRCFGSARIWQSSSKSWAMKGSSGEITCDAKSFGLHYSLLGRNTGECQCWPAANENEALDQCRSQCDALGDVCSAFEYSFITNVNQHRLGPQCCFRNIKDWSSALAVPTRTSDCHHKDS